jgi:hypothetical protein
LCGRKIFSVKVIENMDGFMADLLTRIVKYLIEGVAVALAAALIPKKPLPMGEVATVAVLAAAVFAVLDVLAPGMGVTSRQGAGFGLGANLVGFPRM